MPGVTISINNVRKTSQRLRQRLQIPEETNLEQSIADFWFFSLRLTTGWKTYHSFLSHFCHGPLSRFVPPRVPFLSRRCHTFVRLVFWFSLSRPFKFAPAKKNFRTVFKNETTRNRISIMLIILMALILIAIVIWEFDKRINGIENRGESTSYSTEQKN